MQKGHCASGRLGNFQSESASLPRYRLPEAEERPPAQRQSRRAANNLEDNQPAAAEVEDAGYKRKYEDIVEELRRVRAKRAGDVRELGKLKTKLDQYRLQKAENKVTPIEVASKLTRHAQKFANSLSAYDPKDRARVMVAALKVASKGGRDLREDILLTKGAAKMRKALYKVRDLAIKKHLKETVFTPEAFSLLRLITKLSKRECGLIQQSFKYQRLDGGKNQRFKLAPDSEIDAPEIFSLPAIVKYELEALASTRVELQGHADKRGADVAGKPYALDRLIMSQLDNDCARWEGMATKGTEDDPHVWLITGDGAGLSRAESGIRVGMFPGSTEMLNQSSMDVTTVLFYKARKHMHLCGTLYDLRLAQLAEMCICVLNFVCRLPKRGNRTRCWRLDSAESSRTSRASTTTGSRGSSCPTESRLASSWSSRSRRINHSSAKLTGCSPTTRSTSDNHYATVTRARSTTSPSARRRTTTRSLSR